MHAVHVGAEGDDGQVIDQRHIVCFFRDNVAGLYVVGNTVLADGGTAVQQQLGDLLVAGKDAIFPCSSVETVAGVNTVSVNEGGEVVEDVCFIGTVCPLCGIGLVVGGFDGAVDADLKQLSLDDLRSSFQ